MLPPVDAATDEPGPLQHAHVLGGRGEGHLERRRQLAQVALPTSELPDDRSLEGSQKLLQALPRSCVAPVDPDDAVKAREDLVKRAKTAKKK
jgi:hypothetical protein